MQTIIDDNLVPFESDVVKFMQQLVEGLAYLHHRKIAHLDIKVSFINSSLVKVNGFVQLKSIIQKGNYKN